ADRDPLHRDVARVLRGRRRHGAHHPDAADRPEQPAGRPQLVQRGRDDPRDDDDLPRHRPDPRRLRELPHAADDRRARHGVPAAERAVVLAVRARRRRALPQLLLEGRRGERRLDELRPAVDAALTGRRPGPLDPVAAHPLDLVARRRDQLHRHGHEHARARHVVDAHAALRLVDLHLRVDARPRAADAVGRAHADAARPAGGHPLLRPDARRLGDPVPARLLVLRAPRGLHHGPARDGDALRDHPGVRAQADLRLPRRRVLDGRHRVLLDARVGAPHVRRRHAGRARHLLHAQLDDGRGADRREDLQLARDALAREHLVRHADALVPRLPRRVHRRRPLRHLPGRVPDRLAGDRHVLRRRALPLRPVRRLDVRDLRRPLLLVAQDVRPDPRRAAREAALLADLLRLQPHLLPAAHAGADGDAAPHLHVPRARTVGGLQHDLLDRLLRDGGRDACLPFQHHPDFACGEARRERPLDRGHARVVHHLAAAGLELRDGPVRDERAAAARSAPAARGDGPGLMGLSGRLVAIAACAGTGLAVVSGAAGWGTAHQVLAGVAVPPLAALAFSSRKLLVPGLVAWTLFGIAAAVTSKTAHLTFATIAFAATVYVASFAFRGAMANGPARDYVTLTKPRIMSLLLITGGAGYFVSGDTSFWPFAATIVGLALACGGASALNHYLDRDIDKLMGKRTETRPVASGRVPAERALEFGLALSAASFVLLDSLVNLETALLALGGNLFYVVIYTRLLKRSTAQNIVIGGAAGAVPPL